MGSVWRLNMKLVPEYLACNELIAFCHFPVDQVPETKEPSTAWPPPAQHRESWSGFDPNSHDHSAQQLLKGLSELHHSESDYRIIGCKDEHVMWFIPFWPVKSSHEWRLALFLGRRPLILAQWNVVLILQSSSRGWPTTHNSHQVAAVSVMGTAKSVNLASIKVSNFCLRPFSLTCGAWYVMLCTLWPCVRLHRSMGAKK